MVVREPELDFYEIEETLDMENGGNEGSVFLCFSSLSYVGLLFW